MPKLGAKENNSSKLMESELRHRATSRDVTLGNFETSKLLGVILSCPDSRPSPDLILTEKFCNDSWKRRALMFSLTVVQLEILQVKILAAFAGYLLDSTLCHDFLDIRCPFNVRVYDCKCSTPLKLNEVAPLAAKEECRNRWIRCQFHSVHECPSLSQSENHDHN